MQNKIIIVGGVAGGASAAARLRRLNEDAIIIIMEKGEAISYANCGLPYYIGGVIKEKSSLMLQTPKSFNARFNIDVRVNNEVTAINRASKKVTVKNTKTGETYEEGYDKLILAMGAQPFIPLGDDVDLTGVFTLRNTEDTFKIKEFMDNNKPREAVIAGGGFIGAEMAENLANAGLKVTIVELSDQIITPLDYDMAKEVEKHMQSKGVKLLLKNALKEVKAGNSGLEISLSDRKISADMLILAIGVKPVSEIAISAGLKTNEKGGIITNANMRTEDGDIYGVGDGVECVNFVTKKPTMIPLAGPANKQGRIVADNICGATVKYNGTQGSSILKIFDLTVATTGINEKTAKAQNIDYDKVYLYSPSHATYYPGGVSMSAKALYHKKTGKILGVQIVGGEGVDKRCDVIATAIRFNATATDLSNLELCYAPPYSSAKDPVNMIGYVIENVLTGKVKNFHWHDILEIKQDKNACLLDVRTKKEFEKGSMEGFINIPLDDLRGNLASLDKSKKIYVTCQIGLRGYIACRILTQKGFDCYNLSGGYRIYDVVLG